MHLFAVAVNFRQFEFCNKNKRNRNTWALLAPTTADKKCRCFYSQCTEMFTCTPTYIKLVLKQ